jgi:uncharacterized protein YjiS (DUF1127 family)
MHPTLFQYAFLRPRPYASASDAHRPEGVGLHRRLMRIVIEKWKRRKLIATLNALEDRTLHDIGIQRGNIERFADNLCGIDTRIPASTAAPGEWHRGQSRLLHES